MKAETCTDLEHAASELHASPPLVAQFAASTAHNDRLGLVGHGRDFLVLLHPLLPLGIAEHVTVDTIVHHSRLGASVKIVEILVAASAAGSGQ